MTMEEPQPTDMSVMLNMAILTRLEETNKLLLLIARELGAVFDEASAVLETYEPPEPI
jgi:hypothetical protein